MESPDDDVIAGIECNDVIDRCAVIEGAESEVEASSVRSAFVTKERRRRDEVQHLGRLVARYLHHIPVHSTHHQSAFNL